MPVLFLDSSALVKRYVTELGSAWIADLLDPSAESTSAPVECCYSPSGGGTDNFRQIDRAKCLLISL